MLYEMILVKFYHVTCMAGACMSINQCKILIWFVLNKYLISSFKEIKLTFASVGFKIPEITLTAVTDLTKNIQLHVWYPKKPPEQINVAILSRLYCQKLIKNKCLTHYTLHLTQQSFWRLET